MFDIFQLFEELFRKEKETCGPYNIATKRIQFAISRHLSQLENHEDITDYLLPEDRCAHLILSITCNSCISKKVFEMVYENNHEVFCLWMGKIKLQKNIKICTFNTGPGSDIIGIVQALGEVVGNLEDTSIEIISLNSFSEWQPTWDRICSILATKHLPVEGPLRSKFIHTLFDVPFTEEIKQIIREADLISCVNFISSFTDDNSYINTVLKNTLRNMKTEALILIADESDLTFIDQLTQDIRLKSVYGPTAVSHFSCFPEGPSDSFRQIAASFRSEFGITPSTESRIAMGAWIKPTLLLSRLEEIRCPSDIQGMIEHLVEERCQLLKEYYGSSRINRPQSYESNPGGYVSSGVSKTSTNTL